MNDICLFSRLLQYKVAPEYIAKPDRTFECRMKYTSINRTVVGDGEASAKKKAQHQAVLSIHRQFHV
jgi:hypothetical protein